MIVKKIDLAERDFEKLKRTSRLGQAPNDIQRLPELFRLNFSSSALVVPTIDGRTFYLLDFTTVRLEIISIAYFCPSSTRGYVRVELKNETPTYSQKIEDYFIYRTGFSLRGFFKDHTKFISGQERENLDNEEQRKRWDYFFRAVKEKVGDVHRTFIFEFEKTAEDYKTEIKNRLMKVGGILLGGIILMIKIWPFLVLIVLGYLGYRFQNYLTHIWRLHEYSNGLEKGAGVLRSEIEFLRDQIFQHNLSDVDMLAWIHAKICQASEDGMRELGFSKQEILSFPALDMVRKDVTGISVEEWGLIQPMSIDGKRRLVKKHPTHFLGYRKAHVNTNNSEIKKYGSPYQADIPGKVVYNVFGVYFINILYLTADKFGVYSFFFDTIKGRKFSPATQQYYYRDIISIATNVREDYINDEVELETKQINISFPGMSQIQIALQDEVTLESLREEIRSGEENEESWEKEASPNGYKSDMDKAESAQASTKANAILKVIKGEWERLKNPGGIGLEPPVMPPPPGLGGGVGED